MVYVEPEYPNILFAKDGEIYDLEGTRAVAIGGAYSVDKWFRLEHGWRWFEDEQPSEETKRRIEAKLDSVGWKVDVVLSHTCPKAWMPVDLFISGLDQSRVDNSTEEWLQKIEGRLDYRCWYFGHFHGSRKGEKWQMMFEDWDVIWPGEAGVRNIE